MDFITRNLKAARPPLVPKNASPLRIGIIGAARIAPDAIITPAMSHPDIVVAAIAARDMSRAQDFAKRHGIEKVFGGSNGYQQMLDDPTIDAIYNPLPNGLHYEWTMRALAAGKHVLLEKPSSNHAEETRRMFELAEANNLILLEAFHYRFHPAIHRVKDIIDSGELGQVKHISAILGLVQGYVKDGDIRLDFDLGGGGMMDVGVYPLSAIRYLLSAEPISIESSVPTPHPQNPAAIDRAIHAVLTFPESITADITGDLQLQPWGPFGLIPQLPKISLAVHLEGGDVTLSNFAVPTLWHTIQVITKAESGANAQTRSEIAFTFKDEDGKEHGEVWWTTYRYQLEAFVDRVRGREPRTWISAEDSIAQMEAVERIYEKANMPPRPWSSFSLA
ncbi:hypothetical protein BOTBODRAFT_333766 [Botryobasidium botryosum FD-172 SS1]|uniref:D-xylose 1-dehydrogenase (NADP(+), D-xylono-1,5-lactone-forming) n=1 Tax=Botryobasidium botryosum (strain FD-172 SS1) TaxID=930990 RepID=A0A067MHE7_BOTB1|nr:hypothetical protein BOTBODRAFT_333766 [Botryobasidium botryosum FD-172 SS1]